MGVVSRYLSFLALQILISLPCNAIDYEIVKLIELKGSNDTSSILYSKWSREVNRLLATENGQIINIYDTAGAVLQSIAPKLRVQM